MEEKYSFTLKVSAFVADLSKYTDGKETDLDIIEVDQKLVTVVIQPPDIEGFFNVVFSQPIRLAANCTKWSNENEGADKLLIEYLPTEATKNFMYDWDIQVQMKWHVHELAGVQIIEDSDLEKTDLNNTTSKEDSQKNRRLSTDEIVPQNSTDPQADSGIITTSQLRLQLDFNEPQLVSRDSRDTLQIQV